jgi:2-polyprenyl-3-methyl-5-hydroxy-6-metoxy-1,4-benzoquinol methylase
MTLPAFSQNPAGGTGTTPVADRTVVLFDGQRVPISELTLSQLVALQCEQEPAFGRAIHASPKGTQQRKDLIQRAYETVCAIVGEQAKRRGTSGIFSMGMDQRYADLVLRVLSDQQRKGNEGGLFELGCSAGSLLNLVCRAGHRVGGLEVVPELLEAARSNVDEAFHPNLLLGDFCSVDLATQVGTYAVAYWNDVFEHIPVDEIHDYLIRLKSLLRPGGVLITITPNWHMRPSDVTALFMPPRSQSIGFHLKEYKLREVRQLLKAAGFETVETPAFIGCKRIYLNRWLSLSRGKSFVEPVLEFLPYRLAVQACRRLGFSCTLASKPR